MGIKKSADLKMVQFTFLASSYQKLKPKNSILALTFDRNYSYIDNLPHFEISIKLRIFYTITTHLKKINWTLFNEVHENPWT
jgi:hypothetical protein